MEKIDITEIPHPMTLQHSMAIILRVRPKTKPEGLVTERKPDFKYMDHSKLIPLTTKLVHNLDYLKERENHSVGYLHYKDLESHFESGIKGVDMSDVSIEFLVVKRIYSEESGLFKGQTTFPGGRNTFREPVLESAVRNTY